MESKIEQVFLALKNNYNSVGQDENVLIVSSKYIYITILSLSYTYIFFFPGIFKGLYC